MGAGGHSDGPREDSSPKAKGEGGRAQPPPTETRTATARRGEGNDKPHTQTHTETVRQNRRERGATGNQTRQSARTASQLNDNLARVLLGVHVINGVVHALDPGKLRRIDKAGDDAVLGVFA